MLQPPNPGAPPEPPIVRWRLAAETFNSLGWFLPAYITGLGVFSLAKKVLAAKESEKARVLADGVCELYVPRHLAAQYLYRYKTMPIVSAFAPTISECLECSSFGFLQAATSGLAPVIEGICREIASRRGIKETFGPSRLIRDVVDDLGTRCAAAVHPSVSDEILVMVTSYRRFFDERFWQRTSERPEGETLNRHGILHGITFGEDYGTRYNFSRLISVLDLFCFLLSLVPEPGEHVFSCLAPDETEESLALAQYYGYAALARFSARQHYRVPLER